MGAWGRVGARGWCGASMAGATNSTHRFRRSARRSHPCRRLTKPSRPSRLSAERSRRCRRFRLWIKRFRLPTRKFRLFRPVMLALRPNRRRGGNGGRAQTHQGRAGEPRRIPAGEPRIIPVGEPRPPAPVLRGAAPARLTAGPSPGRARAVPPAPPQLPRCPPELLPPPRRVAQGLPRRSPTLPTRRVLWEIPVGGAVARRAAARARTVAQMPVGEAAVWMPAGAGACSLAAAPTARPLEMLHGMIQAGARVQRLLRPVTLWAPKRPPAPPLRRARLSPIPRGGHQRAAAAGASAIPVARRLAIPKGGSARPRPILIVPPTRIVHPRRARPRRACPRATAGRPCLSRPRPSSSLAPSPPKCLSPRPPPSRRAEAPPCAEQSPARSLPGSRSWRETRCHASPHAHARLQSRSRPRPNRSGTPPHNNKTPPRQNKTPARRTVASATLRLCSARGRGPRDAPAVAAPPPAMPPVPMRPIPQGRAGTRPIPEGRAGTRPIPEGRAGTCPIPRGRTSTTACPCCLRALRCSRTPVAASAAPSLEWRREAACFPPRMTRTPPPPLLPPSVAQWAALLVYGRPRPPHQRPQPPQPPPPGEGPFSAGAAAAGGTVLARLFPSCFNHRPTQARPT